MRLYKEINIDLNCWRNVVHRYIKDKEDRSNYDRLFNLIEFGNVEEASHFYLENNWKLVDKYCNSELWPVYNEIWDFFNGIICGSKYYTAYQIIQEALDAEFQTG